MISFAEALQRVCDVASPLGSESVEFRLAAGRVLAEDVKARSNTPARDVSAMDGYGVKDTDLANLPARLPVVDESFAGTASPPPLEPGNCVRIFTGAPVPAGVDRVIIQENVEREGDVSLFEQPPGEGRNIRKAGSDFMAGDTLLAKGTALTWRAMTTAAAADHAKLSVYRRPKAVILATGDELVAPGAAHETPGSIPESVSFGAASFLSAHGIEVLRSERLADQPDRLSEAASRAVVDADIVVVTGGASVGEKDYARTMFGPGELDYIYPKVAIKPGKPTWMARVGKTFIVGLPGNPTSALVTARLFLRPLIFGLTGQAPETATVLRPLVCADALSATAGREVFLRAYLSNGEAHLFSKQDSSHQTNLAKADLLIHRGANASALPPGALVDVLDF